MSFARLLLIRSSGPAPTGLRISLWRIREAAMMLRRRQLKLLLKNPFWRVPREPRYLVFCLPAQISQVAKVSVGLWLIVSCLNG